jgi:hypothetical protein
MAEEEFEERVEGGPKEICPLLTIAFEALTPCLREECAWWDGKRGCAVLSLFDLATIAEVMGA